MYVCQCMYNNMLSFLFLSQFDALHLFQFLIHCKLYFWNLTIRHHYFVDHCPCSWTTDSSAASNLCLIINLSVYLYIWLTVYLYVCLSVCLVVCLIISLSVCLCLFACILNYICVPLGVIKRVFTPWLNGLDDFEVLNISVCESVYLSGYNMTHLLSIYSVLT